MAKPKKTLDPTTIFLIAEQNHHASQHLAKAKSIGFEHDVTFPAVVISALSLEIYFKCLLVIETGTAPQTHDLRYLFNRLNPATQQKIRANYMPFMLEAQRVISESAIASGVAPPNVDFDFVLNLSRNAFNITRYIYEGIPAMSGWVANGIVFATRQAILEKHPLWQHMIVDPKVKVTN